MDFSDEFSNLIEQDDIKRLLKDKKDPCLYQSIPLKYLPVYQDEGWEIQKQYKTKARIKKHKTHWDYFEGRVWSLMANLGFKYMNKDSNFKIKYSKDGLTKQIDVFAANDEVILITECKSAESSRKKDFSTEINEIGNLREKIINRVKQFFTGKPKIAFLFCTNNCIVNEQDQKRMKDSNILWLNQEDIQYFEKLINSIHEATIFQFLGRVFAQQTIQNMKNKVPAIRGNMGGHPFYSFAVEPAILLQISYVLHRVQTTEDTLETYQRIVKPKRISEIQNFLDEGNYFPNAIILNIDTPKGNSLQFDSVGKTDYDSKTQIGILHLPQRYHCAYIIDGQHRLYGYAGSKFRDSNTIPVIAFENLPAEEQSKLFVDINSKQKTVSKNLLNTLDADLRWNSPNKDDAIKALKSKLLQKLTDDQLSPLYKLISTGDNSAANNTSLTLSYLCSYGFGKTNFFGQLQKKTIIKSGYLCDREDLADLSLKKSFSYIKDALDLIKECIPEQWDCSKEPPSLLLKNVGVAALFRLLNDILEHLQNNHNVSCNTTSAKTLFEKSKEYLEVFAEELKNVPSADIEQMSKQYGAGGPEKVAREFQRWINKKRTDFNPPGLEEYIRDSSGCHNEEVHAMLLEFFEKSRLFIFDKLKNEEPEAWWEEKIPIKIQKNCAIAQINDGNKHEHSYYVEKFTDLQEIIEYNWKCLGDFFQDPLAGGKRKDKIKWLERFASFQIRVTKPAREPITESEFTLISETIARVNNKINN